MAGTTRLELATSAVTGQRSNQLNYVPNLTLIVSNIFRGSRVLAATGSQLMRNRCVETPNGPITPDTSLPCGFRQ